MNEPIVIECWANTVVAAEREAENRIEHMVQRYANADPNKRKESLVNGYIIEKHIYSYLKSRFLSIVQPPDNAEDYTRGAGYDFILDLPTRRFKVDVYGQLLNDRASPYCRIIPGKESDADLYIYARFIPSGFEPHGFCVVWDGWEDKKGHAKLPREKDTSTRRSDLVRWIAGEVTQNPQLFLDKIYAHCQVESEPEEPEVVEPVYYEGSASSPPLMRITREDRIKFFRPGDAWRECEPHNFEVKEGEIWKNIKAERERQRLAALDQKEEERKSNP